MQGRCIYLAIIGIFTCSYFLLEKPYLALVVLSFSFLRLFILNIKKLTYLAGITLVIVGLTTFITQQRNQSQLDPSAEAFVIHTRPDLIQISGNYLSFTGKALLHQGNVVKYELIKASYFVPENLNVDYLQEHTGAFDIQVQGQLVKPEHERNLYLFDFADYLESKRIHYLLEVDNIIGVQPRMTLLDYFYQYRDQLKRKMLAFPYEKVGQYSAALILNEQNEIADQIKENYQELGIIHIFSISGLHIQLIISLLELLFKRTSLTKESVGWLLSIALLLYGCLCLWTPGVYRSIVSYWFLTFDKKFNWRLHRLDIFALTLLSALLLDPYLITSSGFQMTYLFSFCLMVVSTPLDKKVSNKKLAALYLSIIMFLVSIPIIQYYFYQISFASVFLNLTLVPVFSVLIIPVLFLIFLNYFLLPFIPIYQLVGLIIEKLLDFIEKLLTLVSELDFLIVITGRPNIMMVILNLIVIGALLVWIESHKGTKKQLIMIGISWFVVFFGNFFQPLGHLTFLDVGQGDTIVYQSPFRQTTLVIDLAGKVTFAGQTTSSSLAKRTIIPALKAIGVSKIDHLVLTHGDTDHIGSVLEVAQVMPIKNVHLNKGSWQQKNMKELLTQLLVSSESTNVIEHLKPEVLVEGFGDSFVYLYPLKEGLGDNNHSSVIYATIGKYKWLFTGDLEIEGEANLLEAYPQLSVDVLKVGHHGSKTSSSDAFIKQLKPKFSVISVGKNNRYNHPNEETMETLAKYNVGIHRTDTQGSLHYFYLGPWQEWIQVLEHTGVDQ